MWLIFEDNHTLPALEQNPIEVRVQVQTLIKPVSYQLDYPNIRDKFVLLLVILSLYIYIYLVRYLTIYLLWVWGPIEQKKKTKEYGDQFLVTTHLRWLVLNHTTTGLSRVCVFASASDPDWVLVKLIYFYSS